MLERDIQSVNIPLGFGGIDGKEAYEKIVNAKVDEIEKPEPKLKKKEKKAQYQTKNPILQPRTFSIPQEIVNLGIAFLIFGLPLLPVAINLSLERKILLNQIYAIADTNKNGRTETEEQYLLARDFEIEVLNKENGEYWSESIIHSRINNLPTEKLKEYINKYKHK